MANEDQSSKTSHIIELGSPPTRSLPLPPLALPPQPVLPSPPALLPQPMPPVLALELPLAAATGPLDKSEHVSIVITTIALFLGSMVVTFITQPPGNIVSNPFIYVAYMFSIYAAFFIGVGLSVHLVLNPSNSNNTIMWVRRKLILIGLGLLSATFVLRTFMNSPLHLLWIVWLLLLLSITLTIIIAIVIIRKYNP